MIWALALYLGASVAAQIAAKTISDAYLATGWATGNEWLFRITAQLTWLGRIGGTRCWP